jgi:hypothetical protein
VTSAKSDITSDHGRRRHRRRRDFRVELVDELRSLSACGRQLQSRVVFR